MNPAGFLFRSLLLAVFTLALLAGAIVTDYYLRHEVTRQARLFLAERGVELAPGSAIEAAREGELALLEKLEVAGVSMGVFDDRGYTPLLAAVQSGNGRAIDFLMNRGAVWETINRYTEPERRTPLAVALADRNFALADRLIAAGADLQVDRNAGVPFLTHAIEHGDEEMIDYLLEKGVDVEYRGAQTTSPLAVARHQGELELMERLIQAGANPDAPGTSGKPLLIEAVMEGARDQVDLLLTSDADVDARTGQSVGTGMSALSFAVARREAPLQEQLLERGASTDVSGTGGEPLLYEVVAEGDRPHGEAPPRGRRARERRVFERRYSAALRRSSRGHRHGGSPHRSWRQPLVGAERARFTAVDRRAQPERRHRAPANRGRGRW